MNISKTTFFLVVIGALLVGMVTGGAFFGSTFSNKGNADVTTSTKSAQQPTVASGTDQALGFNLAQGVANDLFAQNTTSQPISRTNIERIMDKVVPKAYAQTTCKPPNIDSIISDALGKLFGDLSDGCQQITVTLKGTATLYQSISNPNLFAVHVELNITGTRTFLNDQCKTNTDKIDVNVSYDFGYDASTGQKTVLPGGIPPGYKQVCTITISSTRTYGSIDASKCPKCKKPTPTPTPKPSPSPTPTPVQSPAL